MNSGEIGEGGALYNIDAKIATISRCDVDLRLNLLNFMVSLTAGWCNEIIEITSSIILYRRI